MCINPFGSKETVTNNITSAPTPPPAAAVARSAAVAQGDVVRQDDLTSNQDLKIKRKGRDGLRIRLDAGNPGGGTGVNVPLS